MHEMPVPLVLKDVLPDYPALVQFCEHAGVDLLKGWKRSAEHPTNLPERVREAVVSLWQAPKTPVEIARGLARRRAASMGG
jgi:hypothetical protein